MGEAFNVVGDVGEGKNCGGAKKFSRGSHFMGAVTEGV